MPPVLEELGQPWGELTQFGRYRAIVRSEQQSLPLKLHHVAGAHQGRRGNLFIVPLQCQELRHLVR